MSVCQVRLGLTTLQTASADLKQLSSTRDLRKLRYWSRLCHGESKRAWYILQFRPLFLKGEKLKLFLPCTKPAVMLQVTARRLFIEVFPPYFPLSYLVNIYFDYSARWLTSFRMITRLNQWHQPASSYNKTAECLLLRFLVFPICTLWTLYSLYTICTMNY